MLAGEGERGRPLRRPFKKAEGKRERKGGPGAGLGSDRPGWPGRTSTPISSPTIVEGNSARGRDESEQPACQKVGSRAKAESRRLGGLAGHGESGERRAVAK